MPADIITPRQPTLLDIERAAVKAWPALETRAIGGWLWRYSRGGSQRANSVAALADPGIDPELAIEEAERLYAERGAPPRVQVTDASLPPGLERQLKRRGYRLNDPCTTLVARLAAGLDLPAGVEVRRDVSLPWLETYTSAITADRRAVAPRILSLLPADRAFLGTVRDGQLLATTLVVRDGAVAIVECVATRAEARRSGAAEAAMRGAMAWAAAQGCVVLALGAVESNAPAQALYRKLGFERAGRYGNWIRD